MYADTITGSMQRAIDETERRRQQIAFNRLTRLPRVAWLNRSVA